MRTAWVNRRTQRDATDENREGELMASKGQYPEICNTCKFECGICPYAVNPEKKIHNFVGIRPLGGRI